MDQVLAGYTAKVRCMRMKTEPFGIPVAVVSAEDSDVKYAVIP